MIAWLETLQPMLRMLTGAGFALWCGGVLGALVLGSALDPELPRLQTRLDGLDRLASALQLPGMLLLLVAQGGLWVAEGRAPSDPQMGPWMIALFLAACASAVAHATLRRARARVDARLEDLTWEREAARLLAGWRLLNAVALTGLTGHLMLSSTL